MGFQAADDLSLSFFVLFAIVMAAICFGAIRRTSSRELWWTFYAMLIGVFSAAAISGLVTDAFVPAGPMLFALLLIFGLGFSLGKPGRELAAGLPFAVLIGFQGFRLPLEILLHKWAEIGTVPGTMTWTGQNWDIVTGIVSLIAMPFVNRNRGIAIVVNIIGFVLLMNVFRVVLMSSPLPFAWQLENPLMLLANFPYVLIAPLFVLPAFAGHLITFRKLHF